jgi:hypothetical protein
MTTGETITGQSEPRCTGRRSPLWRLFVFTLFWAMVSIACVNVNFVTDVINKGNGYGAIASLELEYDAGVYAALQKIDPTITRDLLPTDPVKGWTVKEQLKGRKVIMRHTFDTLEALQTLPALLAPDSGEDSEPFVEKIGVTAQQIDADTVRYIYTATVIIPARAPVTDTATSEVTEIVDFDSLMEPYPELKSALEQAGSGQFTVQVYLPGVITQRSVDELVIGDMSGGRVRWTFSEETPGTYELLAVSEGSTASAASREIGDILGVNTRYKEFNQVAETEGNEVQSALVAAKNAVDAMRKKLGQPTSAGKFSDKELIVLEAVYYASFCTVQEGKKTCLMPTVYRALPLIKRLAEKSGDSTAELGALSDLLAHLYEVDMIKLRLEAVS